MLTTPPAGTQRQLARRAGVLYVLMAIIGPIGLLYVPSQIVVAGDATATADNVRNAAWLLRLGIASDLVHQILAVFLVLALQALFRPVSDSLARLVVILGALVSVPIVFLNTLNHVAALTLTSGAAYLAAFDRPQLDALTYLFVHLHSQGLVVASVFWGLWLFPFGLLVIRSGFIPRPIGVLLIAAGVGYVLTSFTTLTVPGHAPLVSHIASPLLIGELPVIFWLLIWGVRERAVAAPS